ATLVALWSGLTALAGLAVGLPTLILARMGVGAAEAGGNPTAVSLIGDIVPEGRRATAIGAYYLAPGFGTVISFLVGGAVAATYGWRWTFLLAGGPGLLLALLLATTLRHPRRGGHAPVAPARKPPGLLAVLAYIFTT